jgi:hypothetical protein
VRAALAARTGRPFLAAKQNPAGNSLAVSRSATLNIYNPALPVLTGVAHTIQITTMNASLFRSILFCLLALACAAPGRAWDYEGHRLINQLALDSLPSNFPDFVRAPAARERIGFLGGEADRWRSTPDLELKHGNGPDHYLDLDLLEPYGLDLARVSPFRYEFTAQLALGRAAHPTNFPSIDPLKDADRTRALIGFLPWTIVEFQGKLKAAFAYLKEYEAAGTPEEIANARENILFFMGAMGHFVGDGSQPLHTTKHHHGWVGDNPHGYATNYSIHAWIDGGYIAQFGVSAEALRAKLRPAKPALGPQAAASATNLFQAVMAYLSEQHRQVEPLYRLEKAGKLSGRRELSQEGHDFITGQMLKASQMLGDLWLTAWQHAPPDMYLRSALAKRKAAQEQRLDKAAQ